MDENECYNILAENMKCDILTNNKVKYTPTSKCLESFYLMIKMPQVFVKDEYKNKFSLKWDVSSLEKNIVKEIQIIQSGVLKAVYTSDYLATSKNLSDGYLSRFTSFTKPTYVSTEKGEYYFSSIQHIDFVEKLCHDFHFIYSFETNLFQFIKVFGEDGKEKDIYSKSVSREEELKFDPPLMVGNYKYQNKP